MTSSSVKRVTSIQSKLKLTLWQCVDCTPFDGPVVPDVKLMLCWSVKRTADCGAVSGNPR